MLRNADHVFPERVLPNGKSVLTPVGRPCFFFIPSVSAIPPAPSLSHSTPARSPFLGGLAFGSVPPFHPTPCTPTVPAATSHDGGSAPLPGGPRGSHAGRLDECHRACGRIYQRSGLFLGPRAPLQESHGRLGSNPEMRASQRAQSQPVRPVSCLLTPIDLDVVTKDRMGGEKCGSATQIFPANNQFVRRRLHPFPLPQSQSPRPSPRIQKGSARALEAVDPEDTKGRAAVVAARTGPPALHGPHDSYF